MELSNAVRSLISPPSLSKAVFLTGADGARGAFGGPLPGTWGETGRVLWCWIFRASCGTRQIDFDCAFGWEKYNTGGGVFRSYLICGISSPSASIFGLLLSTENERFAYLIRKSGNYKLIHLKERRN